MPEPDSRPIVVGVPDDDVEAALRFGAREAGLLGCGLRLVHSHAAGDHAWGASVLRRAVALAEELAPGVPVEGRLVVGAPVEAVLATSPDARLVVVRRRDVLHLYRVLTDDDRDAPAAAHRHLPVACVPPSWAPPEDGPGPVTVGLEETGHGGPLLQQALELAHAHGAALRIVHVWHFPRPYDDLIEERVGEEWGELARTEIEELVEGCREDPALQTVPVEVDVHHGRSTETLLDAALTSDVLVLGRNETDDGTEVRLGKSSRAILHGSACPVLLLSARHRTVAPARRPDPAGPTAQTA